MTEKLLLDDVVDVGDMIGQVRERIREGFSDHLFGIETPGCAAVTITIDVFRAAIEAAAQRVVRSLATTETNVDADPMASVRDELAMAGLPSIKHGGEAVGIRMLVHEIRNHQQRIVGLQSQIAAASTKPQTITSSADLNWSKAMYSIERMKSIARNVVFTAPELTDLHVDKCQQIAVEIDSIAAALKLRRPTGIQFSGLDRDEMLVIDGALGKWESDYSDAPHEMIAKLRHHFRSRIL